MLSGSAASEEAITDARATTEILAHSVAEPAIPRGLAAGEAGAVDRFDRGRRPAAGARRARIKIWAADGTIVYSDAPRADRRAVPLGDEELESCAGGGSEAEVSDLGRPENRFETRPSGAGRGVHLDRLARGRAAAVRGLLRGRRHRGRKQEVRPFQRITSAALLILLAVATPMLWALTRRLTRGPPTGSGCSAAAATASDAERRRIARDLHDGVVQDLAGTAFAVSALARESDGPIAPRSTETAAALRDSCASLRSLLVEIHPPELTGRGAGRLPRAT